MWVLAPGIKGTCALVPSSCGGALAPPPSSTSPTSLKQHFNRNSSRNRRRRAPLLESLPWESSTAADADPPRQRPLSMGALGVGGGSTSRQTDNGTASNVLDTESSSTSRRLVPAMASTNTAASAGGNIADIAEPQTLDGGNRDIVSAADSGIPGPWVKLQSLSGETGVSSRRERYGSRQESVLMPAAGEPELNTRRDQQRSVSGANIIRNNQQQQRSRVEESNASGSGRSTSTTGTILSALRNDGDNTTADVPKVQHRITASDVTVAAAVAIVATDTPAVSADAPQPSSGPGASSSTRVANEREEQAASSSISTSTATAIPAGTAATGATGSARGVATEGSEQLQQQATRMPEAMQQSGDEGEGRDKWRFGKYKSGESKVERGEKVWCPRAALAKACRREPRLNKAIEAFQRKHPDATLIYIGYAGSRLFGTSTSVSDVDLKGLFIPKTTPENKEPRRNLKGKIIPPPPRGPKFDQDFPETKTFFYSSADTTARNTVDDVDVHFSSVDQFFVKLLRAEVNALETLFALGNPHVTLLEDPEITPLLRNSRSFLVCKNISAFLGYIKMHLLKFLKLYNKAHGVVETETEQPASSEQNSEGGQGTTQPAQARTPTLSPTAAVTATISPTDRTTSSTTLPTSLADRPTDQTPVLPPPIGTPTTTVTRTNAIDQPIDRTPSQRPTRAKTNITASSATAPLAVAAAEGAVGALPDLGGEGTNVDTVEVEVEDEDEETYGEMLVRGGKILSHARRVMIEAEELLQKETITFPLRKMAVQEVMKLKSTTSFDLDKADNIQHRIGYLFSVAKRSKLPTKLDRERVKALRGEVLLLHDTRGRPEHRKIMVEKREKERRRKLAQRRKLVNRNREKGLRKVAAAGSVPATTGGVAAGVLDATASTPKQE